MVSFYLTIPLRGACHERSCRRRISYRPPAGRRPAAPPGPALIGRRLRRAITFFCKGTQKGRQTFCLPSASRRDANARGGGYRFVALLNVSSRLGVLFPFSQIPPISHIPTATQGRRKAEGPTRLLGAPTENVIERRRRHLIGAGPGGAAGLLPAGGR